MHDIRSNIQIIDVLSAASQSSAQNTAAVDMSVLQSVSFVISAGTFGSSATLNAYLESSPDNSTWTEENGDTGNDISITQMTAAGDAQLNVYRPQARYYRVVVTPAVADVVVCVIAVAGLATQQPVTAYT